jgi:ADP-ribose pyrophosphatase YjhB (NUDIX family)
MKHLRPSAKAIIIRDGSLLVLRMRDEEGLWYLLPGGGVEFGETLHEALRRECREELGVEIEIGPLRFVREYIAAHHEFVDEDPDAHQIEYMFICRIVDGAEPRPGAAPDKGQLGFDWLPIAALDRRRFYPKSLRPHFRRMDDPTVPTYLGDVN